MFLCRNNKLSLLWAENSWIANKINHLIAKISFSNHLFHLAFFAKYSCLVTRTTSVPDLPGAGLQPRDVSGLEAGPPCPPGPPWKGAVSLGSAPDNNKYYWKKEFIKFGCLSLTLVSPCRAAGPSEPHTAVTSDFKQLIKRVSRPFQSSDTHSHSTPISSKS